ncbi:MAG: hypothetical protein WB780_04855 [Candidatus Acidiferrales bacterium]
MTEFKAYGSAAEIEEVVRRFESCEYLPDEFVHARHLTVATWYFLHFEASAAEGRMRAGLQKFIRHHGKSGYHVTITEFWLRLVKQTLRDIRANDEGVAGVNRVVERLNNKAVIYEYFSRGRVESAEAKAGWLEPDLKMLPGAQ